MTRELQYASLDAHRELEDRVAVLERTVRELIGEKPDDGVRRFTAGKKHNGKPMAWILEHDPQYITWCHDTVSPTFGGITEEDIATARRKVAELAAKNDVPSTSRRYPPAQFDAIDDDIPF